jgi:hypothetical protein
VTSKSSLIKLEGSQFLEVCLRRCYHNSDRRTIERDTDEFDDKRAVSYLVEGCGHNREVIEKVYEDQHPRGHLERHGNDGEEEEAQDEDAAGHAVDDVRLQPPEDHAAAPDCGDDGGNTLLHKRGPREMCTLLG